MVRIYSIPSLKRKRSQIKIQEMAFVLVALIILGSLVFMFYSRLQYGNLLKNAEEIRKENTITFLSRVTAMPEIRCSSSYEQTDERPCIDEDKLQIFTSNYGRSYKKIWGNIVNAKIVVLYPEDSTQEYVLFDRPTTKGYDGLSTFIPLCKQYYEGYKCKIALLILRVESLS